MAGKKNSFITDDLLWAETQLASWKAYVDTHPIESLTHQQVGKTVITIQVQGKFIQETLKNYLSLLEVVDKLREREESKVKAKGDATISTLAEQWVEERKKT
mgnify:CR=1 FL=1